MEKEILISNDQNETRIAILESKQVVQLYFERKSKKSLVGNIYLGKVKNVLPSLDAAFVDIGEDKNAFLYINEVGLDMDLDNGDQIPKKIQYVLKANQMIMVQVTKDPMKSKGARLTTYVSIPGRYLVLAPFNNGVGVSKKISDSAREDLRKIAKEIKHKDYGIIVRTAAREANKPLLKKDLKQLLKNWNYINKNIPKGSKPKLLSKEHSLVIKLLRDIFDNDFNTIYVDKKVVKREINKYLGFIGIKFNDIKIHHGKEDLFETFNINESIESALERKIWLKSGGFIVIDYGEAMTVIDVNTGKFTSNKSSTHTILRTNMEAAEAIASQLRLRDIGGIIVIDFIDMNSERDRNKVHKRFLQYLENDKTRTEVLQFSKLGLLEMTRKNVSDGILGTMCKVCPSCTSLGYVKSEETVRLEIERKIKKLAKESDSNAYLLKLNPSIAALVIGQDGKNLKHLEIMTKKYIAIQSDINVALDSFLVVSEGTVGDIKNAAKPFAVGDIISLSIEENYLHNRKDAISRVDGFIVQIINGRARIGENVRVEIKSMSKTSAIAEINK